MNFITRTACLHASVKNERVRESERDNASDNSGVYNISQPDRRIRRNAITSCDGVRDGGNVRRATRTVECLRKDSSDSVVGERYRHTIPPGATRIFRLFRSGSPCPSYPLVPPSVLTSRTLPRPRSRPISTASVLLLLLPPHRLQGNRILTGGKLLIRMYVRHSCTVYKRIAHPAQQSIGVVFLNIFHTFWLHFDLQKYHCPLTTIGRIFKNAFF